MLPGGDWPSVRDARIWFKRERERLGWTHKDVEQLFRDTAGKSYLYIGEGGGDCFDRPTLARLRRFEDGGEVIPDWLYWIPLVIARAAVPLHELWEWDRANIPENNDIRKEEEEAEFYEHTPYLENDELELIYAYKALPTDLKGALRSVAASPQFLVAISRHLNVAKGT